MENSKEQKFKMMTEMPIEKLIPKMAVPTIISMLVSAFYNTMDSIYVGHLDNTESSAAVGIAFPLMAIIQAIGFFFGHGSGNYMSRQLGQHNTKNAEKMAATGFISPLIFGTIIGIIGLIFVEPLAYGLGAKGVTLEYTKDYIGYILLGTPFMMSALVLNNQLRLQGSASFAMIGITSGAILNVILDPIFIYGANMGVGGAALATIISQFISWCILLRGTQSKGNISIRIKNISFKVSTYIEIAKGGIPSLCRQGLASVSVIILNWAVREYGDSAIAAFSIVSKIGLIANSALIGFGQGFQPVCGFNYGAGLYDRVVKAFWFCVKISTVFLTGMAVIIFILSPQIIGIFRSEDQYLIEIGAKALRYQALSLPFLGIVILMNMLLQNIGRTIPASIMAASRQCICLVPAICILKLAAGLDGVEMAQMVADLASFILAVFLCIRIMREFKQKIAEQTLN